MSLTLLGFSYTRRPYWEKRPCAEHFNHRQSLGRHYAVVANSCEITYWTWADRRFTASPQYISEPSEHIILLSSAISVKTVMNKFLWKKLNTLKTSYLAFVSSYSKTRALLILLSSSKGKLLFYYFGLRNVLKGPRSGKAFGKMHRCLPSIFPRPDAAASLPASRSPLFRFVRVLRCRSVDLGGPTPPAAAAAATDDQPAIASRQSPLQIYSILT